MQWKDFNDAMRDAMQAHKAQDLSAFSSAIEKAQATVEGHPLLSKKLAQALEAFPQVEALQLISEVCIKATELCAVLLWFA